jgi:hypothetical protein
MKKLIVLSLLALTSFLGINAQSQIVSQLSDAVTDLTGSFMDNPYHHSNTVKIYENTTKFNSLIKEMLEQAPFGSTDYYQLKNMQKKHVLSELCEFMLISSCLIMRLAEQNSEQSYQDYYGEIDIMY